MSKTETMLAFEAAMKENEELREKYVAAQKRIAQNKEAASDGELLVKAAAEVGFTLTLEEIERSFAQSQEIDDEELDNVAGGAKKKASSCWVDYYCHYAFEHDSDGNIDRDCFQEYICMAVFAVNWEPGK